MLSRGNIARVLVCAVLLLIFMVFPAKTQTYHASSPIQLGRGYISNVVWSPRGEMFGVTTAQGVWLYASDLKLVSHLNTPPAFDLAWNNEGTKLLTSHKGKLLVWAIGTNKVIAEITSPHDQNVPVMVWNSNGGEFAVSWDGGLPQIWREDGEHPLLEIHGDSTETPQSISKLVWTAQALMGFSSEGNFFVWDSKTGEEISQQKIIQTQRGVFTVDQSTNHIGVIDSFNPSRFSTFDRLTGQVQTADLEDQTVISAVAWQPQSSLVVLVTDQLRLQVWEMNPSLRLSKRIDLLSASASPITRLPNVVIAWHPDGGKLLLAGGGTMFLWDIPNAHLIGQIDDHTGSTNSFAWSPDSTMLVTAHGTDYSTHSDDHIRVWDVNKQQIIRSCMFHTGPVNAVAWNPHRPLIASGAGSANRSDSHVIIGDPFRCEVKHTLSHLEGDSGILGINDVAWNTAGTLVLASGGGVGSIWDVQQQSRLRWFDVGGPFRLAWNSEHHLLTGAFHGKDIFFLDTNTGQDVATLSTGFSVLKAVQWSADGQYLAAAGQKQNSEELRVWDAAQLHLRTVIESKGNSVSDLAWHPLGQFIAAAAQGQINIYEWESGSLMATLNLDSTEITQIGWSPDGLQIAASTAEGVVWVWRWE